MLKKICLFYLEDDITLFHSLYPILSEPRLRREINFSNNLDYVLNECHGDTLILMRFYKRRDIAGDKAILSRLRDRYQNVWYFDDTASADELNTAVFPYVDRYLKKQIHKDRSTYLRPSYGKRAFSDYYHKEFGINDTNEEIRHPISKADLTKMELSWNLGIGCYPKWPKRNGLARRIHPVAGVKAIRLLYNHPQSYQNRKEKIPAVSARYGMNFDRETVAYHRSIYQKTVNCESLFRSGRVSLKEFNREMAQVAATFSPFGWGEICFRDFEAIINRSALIKPDMNHIETWPDIYIGDETYKSVNWDSSDLQEKTMELFDHPTAIGDMTTRAREIFIESFEKVNERAVNLLLDGKTG